MSSPPAHTRDGGQAHITYGRGYCTVCQHRMDPVLALNGYSTHPCCDPHEISPQWKPGDQPKPHTGNPTGITAGRRVETIKRTL